MIIYISDGDKSSILYSIGMAIDNEEDTNVKQQLEALEIKLTEQFYEHTNLQQEAR